MPADNHEAARSSSLFQMRLRLAVVDGEPVCAKCLGQLYLSAFDDAAERWSEGEGQSKTSLQVVLEIDGKRSILARVSRPRTARNVEPLRTLPHVHRGA